MSSAAEYDCGCFYCEMPLTTRHEHDHYPVPKSAGGTETVPVCLTCHDAKDRIPLDCWPLSTAWRAWEQVLEVWPSCPWGEPPSDVELLPPGPGRVLLAHLVRVGFGVWPVVPTPESINQTPVEATQGPHHPQTSP